MALSLAFLEAKFLFACLLTAELSLGLNEDVDAGFVGVAISPRENEWLSKLLSYIQLCDLNLYETVEARSANCVQTSTASLFTLYACVSST